MAAVQPLEFEVCVGFCPGCEEVARKLDEAVVEVKKLQEIICSLAERVATQSELLTRQAAKSSCVGGRE